MCARVCFREVRRVREGARLLVQSMPLSLSLMLAVATAYNTHQQAGTFARVYRKSHAEFLKRKQLQQQLQQQQLAMPITVKKEEKEGDDVLAAALAAELEEGPIGQAGEQFQPSLNWAGLRQLVLETARAAGDAGGGGGKRTQALQNAPALVTAALAARGLLSLEGDGGGQGAVQRLRATVNAAMARLASEGGRLGQGMVDGLGLLARADVLLQEIRGAYGGGKGGKRGEQEEEERLGAADPLALARFWVGVEGTPTEQPTVVVSGLAAWIAGLDAAAVDEEGGVGSAEALAAALTRVDARFEEGKGPYRLEARGRTVLRVTHTAAAVEESSRLGRQQQEGQWSGTEWAADVVLGKEKHGPSTTPAAAAMVPVLVRVVVEGNAGSAWSRRAEAAAAGALLRWGFQKGGSSSRGTVRTVAAVLEELRATLRPGVCGLTGRALAMDAGGGGAVELVAPYCTVSGGGRLAYSYCHY